MYEDVLYETFDKIIALSKMAKGYMDSIKDCNETALSKTKKIGDDNEEMKIKDGKSRNRQNGTYEVRYRKSGITKSFYGKTKTEAMDKYKSWIKTLSPDQKIITKALKLTDWIIEWANVYKKPNQTEDTFKITMLVVNKHIVEKIGNMYINSITNANLQSLINEITTGNTQKKVKDQLKSIFKYALINKKIKSNPAEGLTSKKYEIATSVALTKAEQEILLNTTAVEQNLKKYYIFVLLTGQRRSEALRFNPNECTDKFLKINGTKTEKSKRMIPYFDSIKKLLGEEPLTFDYKPDFVTRNFKKIIPTRTVRDLRKTFATNCHELGISQKVVQEWLGHTTIAMTMDVYTDIRPEFMLKEAEKLTPKLTPKHTPKNNNT